MNVYPVTCIGDLKWNNAERGLSTPAPGLGSWGSTMAADRDAPRTGADDNTVARARTGLTEALAELSRLTRDPFSEVVARVLADLDNVPAESDVGVDTVRKLLHCSTEHQRVAIELEAAARYCRLVEQEINQRVNGLLAGRKENALLAIKRSSIGHPGWLSKILRGSLAPRSGEKRVRLQVSTSRRLACGTQRSSIPSRGCSCPGLT